jgi:hypothetical protein
MGAYFLAFHCGDDTPDWWQPCFFTEDMTEREMEILLQVMERQWGFDEESSNDPCNWFDFQVVGATENIVCFVELRQKWALYLETKKIGCQNNIIQHLHQFTEEYAVHIRSTRSQIPRGYFLTVDYGSGIGEVFNYVDNLTEQEIDILTELLRKHIYEQGGVFDIAAKEDLAVNDPARCIQFQWDWEILEKRIDSDDIDENNPNLSDYNLSRNVIERILKWRATTPTAEANKPESNEADGTENVGGISIVRADTNTEDADRKDSEADSNHNFVPRLPDTPDVRDLCHLLQKELPKGRTQNEIAREFTGEMPGDDKKAQSLLRQARRYRHLWSDAES